MATLTTIPKKGLRSASRILDNEAVVFHTTSGRVHVLNAVASFIWEQVDGKRSAADIASQVCERYEVAREQAERDVLEFLETLKQAEVLDYD